MADTSYGIKKKGNSRFIIVAPHAAGFDLYTKEFSMRIARHLNAFLIINTKYHKKRREDFNKLVWPKKEKEYKKKHKDKKEFFDNIQEFVNHAHKFNKIKMGSGAFLIKNQKIN